MTLINRAALRQQVNNLYATATAEQQKILLDVMELIETAPCSIAKILKDELHIVSPSGSPQIYERFDEYWEEFKNNASNKM